MLNYFKTPANIIICLFILFTAVTSYKYLNSGLPVLDSPVYLYIAQQMREGAIPYRDIFDHKTPGLYFINLLGLNLGEIKGVVVIEAIFITSAAFLGFKTMQKLFGLFPAVLGSLTWLIAFFPNINGGNFPEDYVLPLQFLGICLFLLEEKLHKQRILINFLLGVILGCAILIKQNAIGVFLAYILVKSIHYLISKKIKDLFSLLTAILIGSLTIILITIIYLWTNNALVDFYNFAIRFNAYYPRQTPFSNILNVVYHGLFQLYPILGIVLFTLFGWLDLTVLSIYNIKSKFTKKYRLFAYFLIILLPIEFILASTSGRFYFHYYFPWLPIMALFSGYFFFSLIQFFNGARKLNFPFLKTTTLMIFFCTSFFIIYQSTSIYINAKFDPQKYDLGEKAIVDYLKQHTNPNDYVLVWGARTEINYGSQTKSPTRYFYQSPLYTQEFQTTQMYDEWLEAIKKNKPKYVIDETFPPDLKHFAYKQIDCNADRKPQYFDDFDYFPKFKPLPQLLDVMGYICQNYKEETRIGNWRALKLKSSS